MKEYKYNKAFSLLMAAALGCSLPTGMPVTVCAANSSFITDISLAEGADAMEVLQEEGYSVYPTSLNYTDSDENRVYLGYKTGKGDPVTNVIVSEDKGDTFTAEDGFVYMKASDTDVDAGMETANGLMYFTTDPEAGEPLVGFDVLMADSEKEEVLYAIPNDGAEVIRRDDGTPCDLDKANDKITLYMAQIRDGLVKPYVSEIAVVTGSDKYDAVYKAASHGYNYYIEGDIEEGDEGYTILACDMTQNEKEALTDVIAVSAGTVSYLEEKQITTDKEQEKGKSGALKDTSVAEDASAEDAGAKDESAAEPKKVKAREQNARPAAVMAETVDAADGVMKETVGAEDTEAFAAEGEDAADAADAVSEDVTEDKEPADEGAAADEAVTESADLTESITESLTDSLTDSSVSDDAIKLTGEAIQISGVEYTRVSSRQIGGAKPCYLYATKNKKAGNPIAMVYSGELEESIEVIFGTWAYSRFSDRGESNAYIYAANEDKLEELRDDKTVYVRYPVYMLDVKDGDLSEMKKSDLEKIPLSLLAAKEGISRDRLIINGLKEPVYDPPKMERDEKANVDTGLQSSVFGEMGGLITGIGSAVILAGIASAVIISKKRKQQADK